MKPVMYLHTVQYYETDKMNCVHHSNYIRWFEEARTDFMEKNGFGYPAMEAAGLMSPVLRVNARYHTMARFGETVEIETSLVDYSGTRIRFSYAVRDKETATLRCTGETEHCFLGPAGRPVILKKASPGFHQAVMEGKA